MKNKAQELEVRNIMQGLEEFANFMSFRSSTTGLKVISVETVEQDIARKQVKPKADVFDIRQKTQHADTEQAINKSLTFEDEPKRVMH